MRGWDFFYFSRRCRKQRAMARVAATRKVEDSYTHMAEEYEHRAACAMRD